MPKENKWAPIRRLKICQRCKGQCCYLASMTVILDYEKANRTLHKYRYELKELRTHGKVPVLKKRKDGSCVYFDREKRTCSIYNHRPWSCKAFFCGRGRKGRAADGWNYKDHVWKLLLAREREVTVCDPSSP